MSYNHTSIKSIIDKINRSYFIPDIQRNYVWLQNPKTRKIEQLFDSLMRGYPIGAFLFWELKKNDIETDTVESSSDEKRLNFQLYKFIENYDSRHPNNEKYNVSQLVGEELHIVLDGQQRLTSLYIGLRGTRTLKRPYSRTTDPNPYETKKLYLNLLHKPTDETPEDSYQFEFKTDQEAKNAGTSSMWFRVGKVLDFANKNDIRAYCRNLNYSAESIDVVEDLWTAVNDNDVISFFEEKERNLDKVLKIFIRVNSGGMQLSYSDLLMSLLTATFKTEIREQMENVVERMDSDGFNCFGRDQILKTCMLMANCSHVFKMENFSKKNIQEMETNWDSSIECLYNATTILKSIGYANHLSSGYIITVICMYLYKKSIKKVQKDDKKSMTEFVRIAQMRSFFTTSLDTKLSKIKDFMKESNDFTEFLQYMKTLPEFDIDTKYLEWVVNNAKYGAPAVLPILQLLYPNLKYDTVTFHIDHIYPKSKFNKKNQDLAPEYIGRENELWNLQLLEGTLNEEKNDTDPDKWIAAEMPTEEARKEYYNGNYIPEDFKMEWNNISDFERKRKEALLNKLMEIFGLIKPEEFALTI